MTHHVQARGACSRVFRCPRRCRLARRRAAGHGEDADVRKPWCRVDQSRVVVVVARYSCAGCGVVAVASCARLTCARLAVSTADWAWLLVAGSAGAVRVRVISLSLEVRLGGRRPPAGSRSAAWSVVEGAVRGPERRPALRFPFGLAGDPTGQMGQVETGRRAWLGDDWLLLGFSPARVTLFQSRCTRDRGTF